MAYLGNQPSNNFVSLKRQVITGNGGSTYTLDHAVASVNDVAIFVNNVRQDPASYSISTTALTLGGTISSSDSCYVIFLGQALQTVTPDANTITTAMIQNDAVTSAKVSGLGNYVVEKISTYTMTSEVSTSSEVSYLDIAGGNTINFTPTSTSDIILFWGQVAAQAQQASDGYGIGIKRNTSSSITSSSDTLASLGSYARFDSSSNNYMPLWINADDTSLSAGTTYYYEIFGLTFNANGVRTFNRDIGSNSSSSEHRLTGVHYKYIG